MKKEKIRIAIAQINCTVGDICGNSAKIMNYLQRAKSQQADIICFPELSVTGYPPEDLLLKPKFIKDNLVELEKLAKGIDNIIAVVGFVDKLGNNLYNAAAVIYKRKVLKVYHKNLLPNYSVFDEKRYFSPGNDHCVFRAGDIIFGVNICEDIWHEYGPLKKQVSQGAKLILNINASPYYAGKTKYRESVVSKQAKNNDVTVVYANLIGGQDELVFDGQSMIVGNNGKLIAKLCAFEEGLLIKDLDIPVSSPLKLKKAIVVCPSVKEKDSLLLVNQGMVSLKPVAEIYKALVLGLHDYVRKNNFHKVVIGLSGGIDSSLVASLAVDALGKDNVVGVFMPSRYSSKESEIDAEELANNLGIRIMKVSIEQIYKIYLMVLEPHFLGCVRDVTEENLQARIRGNILMALSNKFGWLVLTTGNKSEMSTGYATLYGDMAGGFAVIKDVPKMLVYELSGYRNSLGFVIPERVIVKEPTAELRQDQKDSDTLPAYSTLDKILKRYVEEDFDLGKIIALGFQEEAVKQVLNMVDKSEYKRRQAPPGVKITPKAFGKDRRMPITNKYRP